MLSTLNCRCELWLILHYNLVQFVSSFCRRELFQDLSPLLCNSFATIATVLQLSLLLIGLSLLFHLVHVILVLFHFAQSSFFFFFLKVYHVYSTNWFEWKMLDVYLKWHEMRLPNDIWFNVFLIKLYILNGLYGVRMSAQ